MAEFDNSIMRAHLAATWFALSLQVAQEHFGRSYLSLSEADKSTVDKLILSHVDANYKAITPEVLMDQQSAKTTS